MNRRRTRISLICYSVKRARLFRNRLPVVNGVNILPLDSLLQNLQSIRTRRLMRTRKVQIRGVWDSIRPRNQYRSAAFVFALFWEIGRFVILICRYLPHQFNKNLNKVLISIALAYIFCLRTPSPVFAFTSLRLPHLLWDFQLQSWPVTHLRFSQWISSQCRPIEGMNSRFETKLEEEERIVLRACLKISIETLSYQRKSIWGLVWAWHTLLLLTFDLHVHICSLDQIFSLCYLFSRHASYKSLLMLDIMYVKQQNKIC